MQPDIPSQSFVWGVLAARFQSELTRRKSGIWRLSGLREEYGPTIDDHNLEREQIAIVEELAGLLVQAVIREATYRLLTNNSGRRAGRPPDVITAYLAPELLSVFLRCHDSAGRQTVATSIDGKPKQIEAGQFFEFIKVVIEPLNRYLTTELHRRPLSASRLARFALDGRRRIAQELKQSETKFAAKKAAVAVKRQLPPLAIALQRAFAIPV